MIAQENHKKLLLAAVPAEYRARLRKAIALAEQYYTTTVRWSGEPLLNHVLRSARHYADLRIDFNGIVAAVLHHKLPDHVYSDKTIFDDDVLGLLKNVETVFAQAKSEGSDTKIIHKFILSFKDDIRITLIKLSEKYDNARTIDLLPEEKKLRVARRLLDIYAPLAEFMNLVEAKREFQLHGFRVLHPEEYDQIAGWAYKAQHDIHEQIEAVRYLLDSITQIVNIKGQIWGRVKSYYSIWRKLNKHDREGKSVAIESLNDLLAFTIMVESVDQCYAVAYALKDYGNVSDSEFEDYIRSPKPNGFSEIQLVCHFPEFADIKIEVQVMTREMYWHNTYGPASHIEYKLEERRYAKKSSEYEWVEMVHQEIEKSKKYNQLIESRPMRLNLFTTRVYTFTPKHRIIELPKGATAIDFAYQIHTSVGNGAQFARINGETANLSTTLNNGDIVEILTDPKKKAPTENWLAFAKSKQAQTLIRTGLRKKTRRENDSVS